MYVIVEHAKRRGGLGLQMTNFDADPFADQSVTLQLPRLEWQITNAFTNCFLFDRCPVTCTTILTKQNGATPSRPFEGTDTEDYWDIRQHLVDLGLYKDVNMGVVNNKSGPGQYRHAEECLRHYARTGYPLPEKAGTHCLNEN